MLRCVYLRWDGLASSAESCVCNIIIAIINTIITIVVVMMVAVLLLFISFFYILLLLHLTSQTAGNVPQLFQD